MDGQRVEPLKQGVVPDWRADFLREWSPHTMCHMSCVTCHESHVTCHMSRVKKNL